MIRRMSESLNLSFAIGQGIPNVGYSIAWIAFKGKDKDDVLSLIGLVDTGKADLRRNSPVTGAALPTGWYVVFFNDRSYVTPERLSMFSTGCLALACQVEEHVMESAAFLYRDGRAIWTVTHEPERGGRCDLSVVGDPPDVFSSVRDSVLEQMDDAFDIPVQLAAEICGYWHDRWKDGSEPKFLRLERAKT
jgi:hypothetical protein